MTDKKGMTLEGQNNKNKNKMLEEGRETKEVAGRGHRQLFLESGFPAEKNSIGTDCSAEELTSMVEENS